MRARVFFMLGGLCLAAGWASAAACQAAAMSEAAAQEARAAEWRRAEALADEIQALTDAGRATPEADAAAAADRGEFGLMAAIGRFGHATAPGAICFTPRGQPARSRARFRYGDAIAEREMRWFAYADAYNRLLTARPDYPDADLCRPATERGEDDRYVDEQAATRAARPPSRPPRSLHEAARWGNAADVRRLLGTGPVDAADGIELSPLAWAVLRGNRPAADALLAAGASPWAGEQVWGGWPVYFAAALGRGDWFARLAAYPGRPFERWSNLQLSAAVAGGDPAIVRRMLREPHEPVRIDMLRTPLPSAALVEMLLRDRPAEAGELLRRAADLQSRADLVRLALARGADPNAPPPQAGQETVLGSAAQGIWPQSLEIVDLLLRAGADPNAFSWRTRPLWRAVQTIQLDRGRAPEIAARARAVFQRLRAGGADINLPDFQGRPPIWTLLFPMAYAHRRLDAGLVTPDLLELLVRSGLDLNARWEGDRVLTEVERQAGAGSELAVTLRRLGARR